MRHDYSVVALRKDLSVEQGDGVVLNEYRWFFYITKDWDMTEDHVVAPPQALRPAKPCRTAQGLGVRPWYAPGQDARCQLGLCGDSCTRREH